MLEGVSERHYVSCFSVIVPLLSLRFRTAGLISQTVCLSCVLGGCSVSRGDFRLYLYIVIKTSLNRTGHVCHENKEKRRKSC